MHEVEPAGRTELEMLGEEPHRSWSVDTALDELLARPWSGAPRVVS